MKILNADLERQLKDRTNDLKEDVTIALFTKENCNSCSEAASFMEEVAALSDKIHLVNYDLIRDADKAAAYNIQVVPSIVLLDSRGTYRRIKFNGTPAGYEIISFITALLEVSGTASQLPDDLVDRIEAIEKPVNIKVFVTLSCPRCSGAVQKAYKLALMNSNIEAEMIEAESFEELVDHFKVSGVPEVIINNEYEIFGNQPLEIFLDTIEEIS